MIHLPVEAVLEQPELVLVPVGLAWAGLQELLARLEPLVELERPLDWRWSLAHQTRRQLAWTGSRLALVARRLRLAWRRL